MPDIFTAIGILALGLLLIEQRVGWPTKIWLLVIVHLSCLMHSSNLLTFSLVVLTYGAVATVVGAFRRQQVRPAQWLVTTAVVLVGWVVLPTLHAAMGGGFAVSRASSAFLMARLVETGIMDEFLSRNCDPADQYRLCAFRDKLPNDAIAFMWDSNSPLAQTGGWQSNQQEYQQIIRRVLTSPRYYPYLVSETAQATLRQLTHVGHGDGLSPFRENTNPYWKIGEFMHYELKEYMSSMQNRNQLNFTTLNERTYGAHLASLVILAVLLLTRLRRMVAPEAVLAVTVLGLGVLSNALVTGGLANVLDRLQSRVSWVLLFAAVLLLVQYGAVLVRQGQQQLNTN
ncbi:hypothetical protein [Hymenobacter wooponensis]|uniref:Uncharacterized protein n=1 Tax=Hymenobacter wooponensis TaxID=1525360 RepID=A0A4Z0MG91_9BACT|nr:hypothetical protein [Hymenobacter wooponensis]TGD78531.1 hypothetical protein EU557_20745 [Hymenobacter wooponensis]